MSGSAERPDPLIRIEVKARKLWIGLNDGARDVENCVKADVSGQFFGAGKLDQFNPSWSWIVTSTNGWVGFAVLVNMSLFHMKVRPTQRNDLHTMLVQCRMILLPPMARISTTKL